jgi:phosphatidylglycerophosphate synthase
MDPESTQPIAEIIGTSTVRLWGLDGAERLRRQLAAAGIPLAGSADAPPAPASTLLLRGDHLFDERTLRDLASSRGTLLVADGAADDVAALHIATPVTATARAVLDHSTGAEAIAGATVQTAASLSSAFVGHLLKAAPPLVVAIRPDRAPQLERYLFDGSYKGVTDLVTKWVWPAPARWVTRWCARLGISPNAVTATSLVLALLTIVLFAQGRFGQGLVLAWVMTFLDTVDGKLARVTVTSTRFGHFFDHVIDLIHPPLWYVAWGYGAAGSVAAFYELDVTLLTILAGYIIGRLIEGAFDNFLAGFSLFVWQPVDSYMRLVTARRNPNLLLLSFFALAGLPLGGLIAVAVWTLASTVLLAIRLAQAAYVRARHGRLHSWLEELGMEAGDAPSYARPFMPRGLASDRFLS